MNAEEFCKKYPAKLLTKLCKNFEIEGTAKANKEKLAELITIHYDNIKDEPEFKEAVRKFEEAKDMKIKGRNDKLRERSSQTKLINAGILEFISKLKVGDFVNTKWQGFGSHRKTTQSYSHSYDIHKGKIVSISNGDITLNFDDPPFGVYNGWIVYTRKLVFNKFLSWRAKGLKQGDESFFDQQDMIDWEKFGDVSGLDGRLDCFFSS